MRENPRIQKLALAITRWIGSPASIFVHTIVFAASFAVAFLGLLPFDEMLLILTTILSLEAIYLALFIQMTVNYTTVAVQEVGEDIGEIQEDIGEIQENVDEITEDVSELQEDIEEISEDVEEINEEESDEDRRHTDHENTLAAIQADLRKLMADIERLKSEK